MDLLHTLFYFIVAIGILVAFHEFGHFWVARKVGVKVLRFSIGFGKVFWSYQKNPADTEYVLSAIPLGGYVKMVDEREGEVAPEDLPYSFNRQPVWARIAIVAAGPLFNLMLAVILFWGVLVIGETGIKPILGAVEQGTLAAQAGFQEGDEITAVNGKLTPTWIDAMENIVSSALEGEQIITVNVTHDSEPATRTLTLDEQDKIDAAAFYKRLGFKPWSPSLKPIIGRVLPDSSALAADLRKGDLIISADNTAIKDWQQWVEIIKAHPDIAIHLMIERDGVRMPISITPKAEKVGDKTEGKIGAGVLVPEELIKSITVERALSPIDAIPAAFKTTYFYCTSTLKMMGRMLIGKASVENLSGPISIAQYAGQSADMGFVAFIKFLGLVSVSLGVLNLLPIPVLDGGHLLFFALEAILRKPVPEKVQLFFQQVGLTLLMLLMAIAMFVDVQRLFQ
ncbi:MAG: RIP metalloprotease RseP [Methylococcales bacterium]|nr:RIP metalloprotease RseP [Methylococcales bacterium]